MRCANRKSLLSLPLLALTACLAAGFTFNDCMESCVKPAAVAFEPNSTSSGSIAISTSVV
jgi:hypothetical protein